MSTLLRLMQPVLKWYLSGAGKKSLPDYEKNLKVPGLNKRVEILRDRWAVPHIYAETRRDVFFAQGFVHAQDRLWQMELYRRVASGRVSELFGKLALDTDRIARTLGFERSARGDLSKIEQRPDLFGLLQAYADGVNAFVGQCRRLPPEFKLLKRSPEPWRPLDALLVGRFIGFQLSVGFQHEIERMRLVQAFGLEKALELFPEYPASNPAILERSGETHLLLPDGRLQAFNGPFLRPLGASNNWAVAASKMENGSAALCNDPHLLLNQPNIWYENHLCCPDYEATGVSIAGAPLVLIGHNRKIAWGCTVAFTDQQDCFLEQFVGENRLQYKHGDRVLKAKHIEEVIRVKGQKQPHVETVVLTHHGPVISDVLGINNQKISLCSQALRENEMMQGFYELNLAQNWDDFVRACIKIEAPALNVVYADTSDNIGYYVTGKVPVRKMEQDFLPRPGWLPEYDWRDFVPGEEMPHSFNPASGYVFSCNNKIVGDDYPHYLGNLWMNGYRARRLQGLFASKDRYSQNDFAAWQMDVYSLPGKEYADLYHAWSQSPHFAQHTAQNPALRQAAQTLIDWDCRLDKDSRGGALYQVVKQQLLELLLQSPLDKAMADRFRGVGQDPVMMKLHEFFGHDTVTLLRILNNPQSAWLQGKQPHDFLLQALQNALAYLEKTLGKDPQKWTWGRLHRLVFKHALGVQKPLDTIFDVNGGELYGDTDTLCQTAFVAGEHYGGSIMGASYRQLIDMGNFDNSKCMAPGGQSGNFKSPHYADQLPLWKRGELKPMLWSRPAVEEHLRYRMELLPSK